VYKSAAILMHVMIAKWAKTYCAVDMLKIKTYNLEQFRVLKIVSFEFLNFNVNCTRSGSTYTNKT
jgi:hypothetical protein